MFKMYAMLGLVVLMACNPKKGEPTKETFQKDSVKTESHGVEKSTLDDLVYEGIGSSILKNESLARSQAEQKGRVAIMKVLADDASRLIQSFVIEQRDVFTATMDGNDYGKSVHQSLSQTATLRGSAVSEYTQSPKKDTLSVTIEMPLMNGYTEVEHAVVDVGLKKHYLESDHVNSFKSAFKEFFIREKKKLLTMPS